MQTNNSNPQSISFTFDMPDFSQMSDLVPPSSTVHVQNASELAKKESRKIYRQSTRDPLSHRVIEKRRRDRMNTSLMRLSELIPQSYFNANTQTSRGRIEKTEIIEMAIKYLKDLKVLAEPLLGGEVGPLGPNAHANQNEQNSSITLWDSNSLEHDQLFLHCNDRSSQTLLIKDRFHYFRLGFQYCVNESLRFMLDSGEEEVARVRFSEELNEFGRKIDVDVITKHMLDSDRMKAYSKTLLEIEKDCKLNQITNIPQAMTIDARLNGSEFQPPRTTSTVTLSSACAATVTSFPHFEQYNPTYPDPKTIYTNLNSIQNSVLPSPTQPKFSSTSINSTPIDFSIKNLVPEIELLNVESVVQSQPLKPKFNFDFHSINQNNEINIPKRIIDNPIDVIYNPKKNFKEKFLFQESSESSSNSSFLDSGVKAKLNEFSSSMIKLRNDVPTVPKESKTKDIFEKGKKFVPVFALHPSGRYYVPLEIESTILGMVDADPQIQYSDNSAGSLSSPEEQPTTQMSDVGWLKRRSSGGNDSESTESIQSWDNEFHEVTKRPRYYPIGITVNLAFHQTISLASLKGKLSDIFSSFLNPTIPSGFQMTFQ